MLEISKVTFVKKLNPKYPSLLGFVYLHIDNGLGIDGIGVHRNQDGVYHLAFPRINGKSVVYPLDAKTRDFMTSTLEKEIVKLEAVHGKDWFKNNSEISSF